MTAINNISDLKSIVLHSDLSLNNKIKIANTCMNVIIIGSIKSESELIELIQENCENQYKKVILGNGINPLENGN